MTDPAEVTRFWLDEVGEEGWYAGGAALDALCRERFAPAWEAARGGAFRDWLSRPDTTLAYLILTDQLPRNIHRGTALAFATDRQALSAAIHALARGYDLRIEGTPRQFFYLPLEHAESRQFQSAAVCRFLTGLPGDAGGNLVHARAHREIIRRFGRFPFRNAALGRRSSAEEERFLADEGYGAVVERLKS